MDTSSNQDNHISRVQDPVKPDFDWETAGAVRTDMSEAALSCIPANSLFGGAMVEQGVSTN
jgi:hypothetical protein